ncbi:MAG: hypothetical protein U9N57_01050 [Pseudomonadota bacterium]|nr:hypothetical protein [Pseudomonadota bacterium]
MIIQALTIVPEEVRLDFLPGIHKKHFMTLENTLYNMMGLFSDNTYDGGYWDFYIGTNGEKLPILRGQAFDTAGSPLSGNEVENIRSEYLSFVAWTATLSAVCSKYQDEELADLYHKMIDWFYDQAERIREYKDNAESQEVIDLLDLELEQFSKVFRLID